MDEQPQRNGLGQFLPGGMSPNPAGKPKGLKGFAAYARSQTKDGKELIDFWLAVMRGDIPARTQDRLHASDLLASRGFGKAIDLAATFDASDDEAAGELQALARGVLMDLVGHLIPAGRQTVDAPTAQGLVPIEKPEQGK